MRYIILLFFIFISFSANAELKIVASYPPIQSMVWQITQNVNPVSIIHKKGQTSHHNIQLTPSQMKTLRNADIVFWAGEELENYMPDAIKAMAADALSVPLMYETPDLNLIPAVSNPQKKDPHFWLSVDNAIKTLKKIEQVMSEKDPENSEKYKNNLEKSLVYLEGLKDELKMTPSDKKFIALHDGFDYFFEYFNLNGSSLGIEPENITTPQAVQNFNSTLKQENPDCIIIEPGTTRRQISSLGLDNYGTQKTDAFGWNIDTGPGHYYKMIKWNFKQLQKCKL